jgi:hypothetical protein
MWQTTGEAQNTDRAPTIKQYLAWEKSNSAGGKTDRSAMLTSV